MSELHRNGTDNNDDQVNPGPSNNTNSDTSSASETEFQDAAFEGVDTSVVDFLARQLIQLFESPNSTSNAFDEEFNQLFVGPTLDYLTAPSGGEYEYLLGELQRLKSRAEALEKENSALKKEEDDSKPDNEQDDRKADDEQDDSKPDSGQSGTSNNGEGSNSNNGQNSNSDNGQE